MFADDIVMSDPKTTPETLTARLEVMDDRIQTACLIALAALAVALIVASGHGGT